MAVVIQRQRIVRRPRDSRYRKLTHGLPTDNRVAGHTAEEVARTKRVSGDGSWAAAPSTSPALLIFTSIGG
jgi:hypothetical protein